MRLVAVSDTHGFHRQLRVPDGDVFIHAGDFMLSGNADELELVRDFNAWLGELPHKTKLVTCGNHDRFFEGYSAEARSFICNARLVGDAQVVVEGIRFWLSPWTPRFPEGSNYWAFMRQRSAMHYVWDAVPIGIDVLVTHGPPQGILDEVPGGELAGDYALRRAVFDHIKPRIHFFGHIHEGRGETEVAGIQFANVTQVDGAYRPVYQPAVKDLE